MRHSVSIYLLFLILSLANSQVAEEGKEDFVATDEWQTVKEGQKIPPGLHVRLNLETGLREAKLLANDDQSPSSSNAIIPVPSEVSQEEISRQNLEKAFANLDLSKDDVQLDQKHDEEIRQQYRRYDELKKDFESLNMKIQTDQEILTDLIEQLNRTDSNEHRQTILTDLEYYLHQYDNAILFADLNGLDLLSNLLNSTESNSELRLLTCVTLGAAFQGNPKVQLKALNLGLIQYFLRLLTNESDEAFLHRLLYTLSTLLRNFPRAQSNFLEHGGAEFMVKLLDHNHKIAIRVLTLINDLILEKDPYLRQETAVPIREQLVDHGICSRVSTRLKSLNLDNLDYIEKTIAAMTSFVDVCQQDFSSCKSTLKKLKNLYSNESDFLHHIDTLLRKLQKSSEDL